jgi:hypothetical protein
MQKEFHLSSKTGIELKIFVRRRYLLGWRMSMLGCWSVEFVPEKMTKGTCFSLFFLLPSLSHAHGIFNNSSFLYVPEHFKGLATSSEV